MNRASLLENALRSALDLTGPVLEVVVSNNHSTDETESVVRAFSSPKLRYFETERTLSMVDHWEFILGKAEGEWVVFLCDDDALLPGAISYLSQVAKQHPNAEVMRFRKAVYCYDDGVEQSGNYIRFSEGTRDRVRVVDSRKMLEQQLTKMRGHIPRYLNCAVRRSLSERIRSRHGRAFCDWAPDTSGGMLLLANSTSFLELSRILMLWGKNSQSYGSGALINPAHLRQFMEQFDSFNGRFENTPYPDLLTISNSVLDTLERTKGLLGEGWRDTKTDLVPYLQALLKDLARYAERGHEEYREPIERVRADLRARLTRRKRLRIVRKSLQRRLKSTARRALPSLTRERIIKSPHEGQELRNIYDAAKVFDGLYAS